MKNFKFIFNTYSSTHLSKKKKKTTHSFEERHVAVRRCGNAFYKIPSSRRMNIYNAALHSATNASWVSLFFDRNNFPDDKKKKEKTKREMLESNAHGFMRLN